MNTQSSDAGSKPVPGSTRTTPGSRQREVRAVLDQGQGRRKFYRWALPVVVVLAALAALWFWQRPPSGPPPIQWKTAAITQGTLHETVTATGTLNPVDAVELGAEVSGKLIAVNVDVNDPVKAGQVLAEIDPEQLKSRVQESRASLSSALASRDSAKASFAESELTATRMQALFDRGLASSQELENAQAAAARAKANVASAEAQITVARAGLASAQTALDKAVVVAPIDGIVLARSVEPGQTLTAGFQTPVLFTLGRDLSKLELSVEVDEADIGKVAEGQSASFTVDAYPNRSFDAKLIKLYSLPTKSTGSTTTVVTYSALLTVDNAERLLRPGMTATATITTRTLRDVSLVPNVALRFEPPPTDTERRRFFPFFGGRGGPPKRPPGEQTAAALPKNAERIWVPGGAAPRPVAVEVLGTDGTNSAIHPLQKGVELGTTAIVDMATEAPR